MPIDTQLLKQRFGKSWQSYDEHASVQKTMAQNLLDLLLTSMASLALKTHGLKVLELGCGTGFYTQLVQQALQPAFLAVNDLLIPPNLYSLAYISQFLEGDASNFESYQTLRGQANPVPEGLDLITANAALQWVEDLPRLFGVLMPLFSKNGLVAFSTFLPGNFEQVRIAGGPSLCYYDLEQHRLWLEQAGFRLLAHKKDSITLYFDSAREVLVHCKACGVNAIESRLLGRQELKKWCAAYPKDQHDRYALCYSPLYLVAQRI